MSSRTRLDLDVLVVGGGPAGAACAIRLAQRGGRVAIVEAGDYSRFRIGETLSASVGPLLLELGVPVGEQQWASPSTGVTSVWGQPVAARRPSILNPYGRGWRVDRRCFDGALFAQARNAGAAGFMRCRLATAQRRTGSWTFELRQGTRVLPGRAKWIVAATGRSARTPLASRGSRHWIDRLVGIVVSGGGKRSEMSANSAAIVEATPNGWWYSVRVPDGRHLAVFLTDADLLPKRNEDRAGFLRGELDRALLTASTCTFVADELEQRRWIGFDARSSIHRVALSEGWIGAGDAAMAFDPLCGRGVGEALSSGIEVADWLLRSGMRRPDDDAVPAWALDAATRFNRYQAERLAMYGHERRWPMTPFWQRRHTKERA
jgi:2-polyprenyl-6-methoxyphenol hydroxylase-like FAD-dependent oxidoreductase